MEGPVLVTQSFGWLKDARALMSAARCNWVRQSFTYLVKPAKRSDRFWSLGSADPG
jgi:hypothetical protein